MFVKDFLILFYLVLEIEIFRRFLGIANDFFLYNSVLLLSPAKYCVPGGKTFLFEIERCGGWTIYNFSIFVLRLSTLQVYLPVFPSTMTPNRGT